MNLRKWLWLRSHRNEACFVTGHKLRTRRRRHYIKSNDRWDGVVRSNLESQRRCRRCGFVWDWEVITSKAIHSMSAGSLFWMELEEKGHYYENI